MLKALLYLHTDENGDLVLFNEGLQRIFKTR